MRSYATVTGDTMGTIGLIYLKLILITVATAFVCGCANPEAVTAVAQDASSVRPLLPGMPAPAFEIRDAAGQPWHFETGPRTNPVIVTFYRGTWCPYCNRYLWQMREAERELLAMGYELLFISADRPEILAPYLEEKELAYELLSDNDLIAARAFGIAFEVSDEYLAKLAEHDIDIEAASGRSHHWLPVPATFIIGTDGIIDFQYVNPDYKVRVDPRVLIAAARAGLETAS